MLSSVTYKYRQCSAAHWHLQVPGWQAYNKLDIECLALLSWLAFFNHG